MKLHHRINAELAELERTGNLRQLRDVRPEGAYLLHEGRRYLNLSSNDYLGLTASPYADVPLRDYWDATFGRECRSPFDHGNPASRLMTGNSGEYAVLEREIAALFPGREALVLGCGYLVNSELMEALTGKDDLILADKLVHASMIEGLRCTEATFRRFRHNDVEHLEHLLRTASPRGDIWVLVESLYSMDGDLAPLREIVELKRRYGFHLCVDEAHSFGVRGPRGAGYCAELGLDEEVELLVCTFGKALAGAGACVVCPPLVRQYLINRLRPLIFSTALPPCTLQWDAMILHEMHSPTLTQQGLPPLAALREKLSALIAHFNRQTGHHALSQIIPLPAGSNERALAMAEQGRRTGLWLTAIRHPTVPLGHARIRLSLHAGLTPEQLTPLISLCNNHG